MDPSAIALRTGLMRSMPPTSDQPLDHWTTGLTGNTSMVRSCAVSRCRTAAEVRDLGSALLVLIGKRRCLE